MSSNAPCGGGGESGIEEYRTFFCNVFNDDKQLRRRILKQWHAAYPVNRKIHKRLADVFSEFISNLLYEPVRFKLRHDHFCFFGDGSASLAVHFSWLGVKELDFLVWKAFDEREKTFKQRHFMKNNLHFSLEQFCYDPPRRAPLTPLESHTGICSLIWQRELIRDFVWLVLARRDNFMTLELTVALQHLMTTHRHGRTDIFLSSLHSGVQGTVNPTELLCWNLDNDDHHPEDVWQRHHKNESQ